MTEDQRNEIRQLFARLMNAHVDTVFDTVGDERLNDADQAADAFWQGEAFDIEAEIFAALHTLHVVAMTMIEGVEDHDPVRLREIMHKALDQWLDLNDDEDDDDLTNFNKGTIH